MGKKPTMPAKAAPVPKAKAPKTESLADLKPDPRNARRHSPRNIGIIADSLAAVGAARSIVIDEDNVVLCGNGVIEAAGERGIERVQVVEADGNTIIAVRRVGLTKKQKAQLAVSDNRANELSDWDLPILTGLADEVGLDLKDVGFTEEEISRMGDGLLSEGIPSDAAGTDYDESIADGVKKCTCPKCGHEFPL